MLSQTGHVHDGTGGTPRAHSVADISRSDAGLTLVEVLVTIAIMATLFAAVLGGMATMVKTSALHRRQADVGAVVRTASEQIKAAPYVPCTTAGFPSQYTLAASTIPTVQNPTVVGVFKVTDQTATLQGCSSDTGLQLVQVRASSIVAGTTEDLWIVKSNR